MRFALAAIAVAVIGAANAGAADKPKANTAFVLQPGMAVVYGGMTCTAYTGAVPNMVCVRNDLKGYGVIISQQSVIVAKQVGSKFNIVFKGKNQ
jgi:hypothetical protein